MYDKEVADNNRRPLLLQISMRGPGTSRQRSAPFGRTSRGSTAAAMTRTGTATLRRWTTACRACWASAWSCPRTSTTATRCGWNGRSSPSPSSGRGFCRVRDRPRGPGEDSSWVMNGGDGWKQRVRDSDEKALECACDCCEEAALVVAAADCSRGLFQPVIPLPPTSLLLHHKIIFSNQILVLF